MGLELEGGQLRKGIWAHWCQEQELVLIPYLGTKGRSRWALDIEVTWSNLCVTGCNSGIFCVEMSVEDRSQEQLLPNQICSCCGNTVKPLY